MAKRIRSSTHHHLWAARDGRRAVLAALMLIFVGAASLSDGKLIPSFLTGEARSVAQPDPQPDDDLRTGSILITPKDGNICEHRLIDNETWRIRLNGTIVCDAAVSWQPHQNGTYTSQSRLDAIRDGFVSKR
jgi:hypothetical protein